MAPTRPIDFPAKPVFFCLGVLKEHVPRRLRRVALDRGLAVAARLLRGDRVECPACGATAARWARRRCPSCAAAPRQRLMAVYLRRELGIGNGEAARILHFAPEPGLMRMLAAAPGVDYVPCDLVPDEGHARVDATDIQLAADFDGVVTSHVLEHIPDDAAAMSEMFRVLKPGGWALVLVPVSRGLDRTYEDDAVRSRWDRHRHYGQHDHVRLYGRDFADRLRRAGFEVRERRYMSELAPAEARRFGLRNDVIHDCRKPAAGNTGATATSG